MSLVPDDITAAFVIRVRGEIQREVSVDAGLRFLFDALKEYGDPDRAARAFREELERLKRRA